MIEKQESDDYTIGHRNAKYRVGQKVIVVDDGKCYSNYYDWIFNNGLSLATNHEVRKLWSKYLGANRNDSEVGTELIVVAIGHHILSRAVMYLCEDTNGNPVLISEDGLATNEEKHSECTNLKDNAYWQKIADLEKENTELKNKLCSREHLLRMLVFWRSKNGKEFNAYFKEAEKLFEKE